MTANRQQETLQRRNRCTALVAHFSLFFCFWVTKNSQNAILKIGLLKVVKKKCGEN
jgi:hypothetical protein